MDFLRYCKNHFKYKFYKILLYILIAFSLFMLFGDGVNASTSSQGVLPGTYNSSFELPIWGAVYNVNSKTSINEVTLTTFAVDGVKVGYDFKMTTLANSYGGLLVLQPINPFVKNVLYSVTIALYTSNHQLRFPPQNSTYRGNRVYLASSKNEMVSNYTGNTSSYSTMQYSSYSGGAYNFVLDVNGFLEEYSADTLTFTFTPSKNCSLISIPFTTSNDVSNGLFVLYGMSIESLGNVSGLTSSEVQSIIDDSGLATADSVEEIATAMDEVKTELNDVSSSVDNLNDSITSESEDFDDSSCGVICKLGKIPGKIIDGLLDGIKSLFIPEDGYFQAWFDDLKTFFEEKLGLLATPFTIFIDFINMYLELDSSADIIINIPDITVPNFDDHIIIQAQTFNWSELLKSKESLNTLWQLYLSFVDVFLILNFIGLCETKYNRIFGGDTSNYEYYTVEDSISYDGQTGEVISQRQNERRTTRKKV